MAKMLNELNAKMEIGYSGKQTYTGQIRSDEFMYDLKGKRAIRKFLEMRENNATIGAVLYAVEQILRDVEIKVKPAEEDNPAAEEAKEFMESVLNDMDHSLDDHISEALAHLTFGFMVFEPVYKRRGGDSTSGRKSSKYDDGLIGIRKLAPRAPWTIDKFVMNEQTGDILGVEQEGHLNKNDVVIPSEKMILYRTTTINNDPSGRSILRNAYQAYTYLNNLQAIEAIAIERELHGVPVGRIPAEYLSADATDDQVALRNTFEQVLRDLKNNEQGYIVLASDLYMDPEGKPTTQRIMDLELITSNGTRAIDINTAISRYDHAIARSIMAEFLMLGGGATGSYALSKSKTDLFLRSMESYINTIVDTLNKQLVLPLWKLNGFPMETMPKLCAGDVAPHDLSEISSFLRNLNGAEINVKSQPKTVEALMDIAELPFDKEEYLANLEEQKALEEEQRAFDRDMAVAAAKNPADTKSRVVASVDGSGNRTSITYDTSDG